MVTKLAQLLIAEVSGVDDPANQLPGFMVAKSLTGGREVGPDQDWDVAAAEKRIRKATGAEDGPNDAYASCFLWHDESAPERFGSYKFLVCDVAVNKVCIMPGAIRAAAGRAESATIPDGDKAELVSAIATLEKRAGIEAAQKSAADAAESAEGERAISLVSKIRGLLGFGGNEATTEGATLDMEMTEAQLDAKLEAFATGLVEKLAPKADEVTTPEAEAAETVEAEGEVATDAATETAEVAAVEPEAETPAGITTDDLTKALAEALSPYNEILEKVLDRVDACEASLTVTARKSLDGQEAGTVPVVEPGEGNTVADAIVKAFRR